MQPTPPREDAEAGFVEDSREADAGAPDPEEERMEARRHVQESAMTPAPRARGSALGRLAALCRRAR